MKNLTQRTSQHVKRPSGARVMTCSGSLDRSLVPSLRPIDRSIAHSLDRSLVRIISGVRISHYGLSGKLFRGSNFELLACIVFMLPVSECRIPFQKKIRPNIFIVSRSTGSGSHRTKSLPATTPSERRGASARVIERLNESERLSD